MNAVHKTFAVFRSYITYPDLFMAFCRSLAFVGYLSATLEYCSQVHIRIEIGTFTGPIEDFDFLLSLSLTIFERRQGTPPVMNVSQQGTWRLLTFQWVRSSVYLSQ